MASDEDKEFARARSLQQKVEEAGLAELWSQAANDPAAAEVFADWWDEQGNSDAARNWRGHAAKNRIGKRVQILKDSGTRYFKRGQYGYVVGADMTGGKYWVDQEGHSLPGQVAYLVAKTKDLRGGALWFSSEALRFTSRSRKHHARRLY